LFLILLISLLTASYFSSAMEAAFSVGYKDEIIVDALITEDAILSERYEKQVRDRLPRSGEEPFTYAHVRAVKRHHRTIRKFTEKELSLSENGRSVYVGSLAALSVFLNTALVAFLPAAINSTGITDRIGLPYPTATLNGAALEFGSGFLDLTGEKLFIFVAVSLPVLIVGKIVPKHFGMNNPFFYAYRLNWAARLVRRMLGWLSVGSMWLLIRQPKTDS
jgi:hypothetical protein